MYQFSVNNEVIGYAVEPIYIRRMDNGCYGLCSKFEATGIVVGNTPYSINETMLDDLAVAEIKTISDNEFFNYVVQANNALSILGVETEKEEV